MPSENQPSPGRTRLEKFLDITCRVLGLVVVLGALILYPGSHIFAWGWDWGFAETSVIWVAVLGLALLLLPSLYEVNLPGGYRVKFRRKIEEVHARSSSFAKYSSTPPYQGRRGSITGSMNQGGPGHSSIPIRHFSLPRTRAL